MTDDNTQPHVLDNAFGRRLAKEIHEVSLLLSQIEAVIMPSIESDKLAAKKELQQLDLAMQILKDLSTSLNAATNETAGVAPSQLQVANSLLLARSRARLFPSIAQNDDRVDCEEIEIFEWNGQSNSAGSLASDRPA